jgi:glycosyltransferase involved in cell wall biosynthesis
VGDRHEVSIVIPCLDEAATVGACVDRARAALEAFGLTGEVLVVDNGSTDGSPEIAWRHGARVVEEPRRGYGRALATGFEAAEGELLIMADADGQHDFADVGPLVAALRDGADLVVGNRLGRPVPPGAIGWKSRYVGTPVLTWVMNGFFGVDVTDAQCGMRALTREAFQRMGLRTGGMEFASEMLIKASLAGLRVREVPVHVSAGGRARPAHLRPWRDGWRHLKLMLMFSPMYLFLVPGFSFFTLGLAIMLVLLPGPLRVGGVLFDLHTMVVGALLTLLGYQLVSMNFYVRIYSFTHRFREDPRLARLFRLCTLEVGLVVGLVLAVAGAALNGYMIVRWATGEFRPPYQVRPGLLGSVLVVLGVQTIFSSFFLSILGDEAQRGPGA